MKRLFRFLLFWASWGFLLGTLLLLGPVRWTVEWARHHHWTEGEEKIRIYVLILVLLFASFFAAKVSVASLLNSQRSKLRFLWILLPVLGAGFSVYAFMSPQWMNTGNEEVISTQFTIGPYPEREKLESLKKENYTTVVSLLHPAVVPFEPKLLADEQTAAKAAGLEVIAIPMLPWISDNATALDSLRRVVRQAKGKVYVHCYLGKDRVNVARRIIEQESHAAGLESSAFHFRQLDTVKSLERGPVYKLETDVFLTPYPTKEEYMGYVLAANFQQVVSLADLQEPGARELMEEEKKTLADMHIPFRVYNISAATTPEQIQKVIVEIKKLPKPLLVHPFFTTTKEAVLFRQLY